MAIRHSRKRILFYTAGSSNGFEGIVLVCPDTKKQVDPMRTYVFVMGRYIEDVKQDERHVLTLLESIMGPPGLVKEELQMIFMNMNQFGSKIKVSTFWIPGIRCLPAGGQCQPAR